MATQDEFSFIMTDELPKIGDLLPYIEMSDEGKKVRKKKPDRLILEDLPSRMIDTVEKLTVVREEPTGEPVPSPWNF